MATIAQRLRHVRERLSPAPYRWLPPLFGTLYVAATASVHLFIFKGNLREFYSSMPAWYTWPFTILTLLIGALFGVALTLAIAKYRELKLKGAGAGVLGMVSAALATGCPGCFFGLFPMVLGLFGITGTLAILPWSGIELQLLTLALLSFSILTLSEETSLSCELPRKKR